jgi:hypothetical protein
VFWKLKAILLSLVFSISTLAEIKTPSKQEVLETTSAQAFNSKGLLIYKEKHRAFYDGTKLLRSETTYTDPSGKAFATLKSDYQLSLTMPTYVFEDSRRRLKEGLLFENGKYVIFSKEGDKAQKTKVLTDTTNVFSCQGWHYYVINNLDLLENKPLKLSLIFPERLEHIGFNLSKADKKENEIHLSLSVSNFFIRLFAPSLELYYDTKQKKIKRFVGPSNIFDDKGKVQNVEIRYD